VTSWFNIDTGLQYKTQTVATRCVAHQFLYK
jgi:hypothetical protein